MKTDASTVNKKLILEKDFFINQHGTSSLDGKLRQITDATNNSRLKTNDPEYQMLIEKLISGELDYAEIEQRYPFPTDRYGVIQGVVNRLQKDSKEDESYFSKIYESFSPLMKEAIQNASYLNMAIQPILLEIFAPEVDYDKEMDFF